MVFVVSAPLAMTGLSWCRWTFVVTVVPGAHTRSAMVSMGTPLSLMMLRNDVVLGACSPPRSSSSWWWLRTSVVPCRRPGTARPRAEDEFVAVLAYGAPGVDREFLV